MPEDPLRRLPAATRSSPEEAHSEEDGAIDPESNVAAFRISVDLSEYLQQQASCFLWVPRPRDTRTLRWLARRLRRAAALRERFCLLCDTHTLPPDEPLRLLRPSDELRVVRVEHEWQRVFSFRGERAPPAPPPKTKKRHNIDTGTEPPTLPMPLSKEVASAPKAKTSLPPSEPLLPLFSLPTSWPAVLLPTISPVSITKSPSQDKEFPRFRSERASPVSSSKTKKRRMIDSVSTEQSTLSVPQSKPQELASASKAKTSLSASELLIPPFSLPSVSPAVSLPPSVQPKTLPVSITKSPSQDEELQRVKSRALALLQKVEGTFLCGKERERGEEDETDGAGNEWPFKKRRRRVRRRRALPPIDFEQELLSTANSSNPVLTTPELSQTPVIPTTPATTVLTPPSLPSQPILASPTILAPSSEPTIPASPSIPAPSFPSQPTFPAPSLPTQPSILASSTPMLSLSLAPPSPVVLREETTRRLPRVIRALDSTRSEDIDETSQEHNASTAPAPLPQTAVQCS